MALLRPPAINGDLRLSRSSVTDQRAGKHKSTGQCELIHIAVLQLHVSWQMEE